ncbi:MAG: hypothetical protein V3T95_02490, partial [Acidobacteriota bacterium]
GPPVCGQKTVGPRPAGLRLMVLEAVPRQPLRADRSGGSRTNRRTAGGTVPDRNVPHPAN